MKEKVVKFLFTATMLAFGFNALLNPFTQEKIEADQKVILLDLGNVVLHTDKKKAFSSFNMKQIVSFLISHGMPNEAKLYECLYKAYGEDEAPGGPSCIRRWLVGEITGDQVCSEISEKLESANLTDMQKNFVRSAMQNMRSERLCEINYLDPKAAEFICKVTSSVDENGKPIKLVVLSNWNQESFALIRQKFAALFDLIGDENIVVSGQVGMMKPYEGIYEHTLQRFGASPGQCIFIDDTKENVEAARSLGITSILHKDWAKTESQLKKQRFACEPKKDASAIKEDIACCLAAR